MAKVLTISSLNSPDPIELLPFRVAIQKKELFHQGYFIAEGERVVIRLLQSSVETIRALTTKEKYEKHQEYFSGQKFDTLEIVLATKDEIESVVGFGVHQGMIAIGKIPIDESLDIQGQSKKSPYFFVALDHVINADNVGGITRNCAGFGADVLIANESSSSPYYRRAIRNSMGTVFHQKIHHARNLYETLDQLRKNGNFSIIGAHPEGGKPLHEVDLHGNICLVFGNEELGLSNGILSLCTQTVGIPMLNETDSLNVASASAVFFYEVRRQRMTG